MYPWARVLFVALLAAITSLGVPPADPVRAQGGDPPPCTTAVAYPDSLNITAPDPGLAPELAALSGVWEGTWLSQRFAPVPARIVIERIDNSRADLVYAWGATGTGPPGVSRHTAQTAANGRLDWTTRAPAGEIRWTLTLSGDRTSLAGWREAPADTQTATLTRCTWQ
jgi:hypothetical protein